MPKISATNSKGLLISYLVKIILSTLASVLILNSITSFIILKLDISLSVAKYVGIVIAVISALVISLISTTGFKNNFLLLSIISVFPFVIFIFINMLINNTNSTICIIKIALVLATALIVSFIKSTRKR